MSDPEDELLPVMKSLGGTPGEAWRRATFSAAATSWDRVTAEAIHLSQGPAVKLATTAGAAQTTRTVPTAQWHNVLAEIMSASPRNIHVTTAAGDWHARRGKRRWLVSLGRPANPGDAAPGPAALGPHDRPRRHLLDPSDLPVKELFTETGLIGRSGQIRGESAAKYRQVQHFLELLRPLAVLRATAGRRITLVDAGCGSAHLGLALYLYASRLGLEPTLTGVDRNEVLVERVASLAARLRYPRTRFLASAVAEIEPGDLGPVDLLVSLHLCDTATDDALLAGVRSEARAIVLAPCCQHELIAQLDPDKLPVPASTIARHGAIRERLASLLTDQFRALALETAGYRVDVLDFTGPENTGKNLMLRAQRVRSPARASRQLAAREEFERLAEYWNVTPACAAVLGEVS